MGEWIAPPLSMLVFMGLATAIAAYWAYRAWFDADQLRRELLRRQEQLPRWYPLRGFYVRQLLKRDAIRDLRITNTLGFLAAVMFMTLLIVATILGSK